MRSKLKPYRINGVQKLTDALDWDSSLYNDIMGDWDEEEENLDWYFNPEIKDHELENHGVEIKVHIEEDLPSNCWGVDLIGDEDEVVESLANEYKGDSDLPDELYFYIKGQFKENMPVLQRR